MVVAMWGLWLSVAGLGIPACPAPVFTSDPFPKARMAFSRRKERQKKDVSGSLMVALIIRVINGTSEINANVNARPPLLFLRALPNVIGHFIIIHRG